MATYTYRCVAAPRRARKTRDHKTPADALVAAFEAAIAREAAQGWEYLRTDLVPMEAKAGFLSRVDESHQGVMVFRRPASLARAEDWREPPQPAARAAVPDEAPEIPRLGAARLD